uniref:Uncharacterized protein n=1 Tax=Physcomitrium patens TaxID=3218 RepID=A0A7I4B470_PHYPA
MAMRLELLQHHTSYDASPSAARPRSATFHRGNPASFCWRPLRNLIQHNIKASNTLLLNSQICHFLDANPLFMLRPLDRPSCVNIKPSGVAHASARKGGNGGDYDDRSDYKQPSPKEESGNLMSFTVILIKKVVKLAGVLLVLATIFAAAAPSMFSSPRGLKTIMSMASHTIPGTVSVARASLGWRKPLYLEGVTLKGIDGETVLYIPKIETRASLWSIVSGKAGFGDSTVTAPVVDLQQDPASGQPYLALALTPLAKLQENKPNLNNSKKRSVAIEPPRDVALAASVKAPNGDRAQAEGLGFLSLPQGQIHLLRPLKAELDLTPEFGKLYLVRVNPLLGEIIGPAISEDDLPDITIYAAPKDFLLPSDEYSVRIEPMRTVLSSRILTDDSDNFIVGFIERRLQRGS